MRYLALLLLGCGGPAAPFVGTWSGTQSVTFTANLAGSTPQTFSGAVEEMLSENIATGDVDFSSCRMSGKPDGSTLHLNTMLAPCVVASGGCSAAFTVTTGQAVVRGAAMTLDYGGGMVRTCPGLADVQGTYSAHANLTRR